MSFPRKKILAVAFTILSIIGYGVFVFAAAPSGGYNSGQTLDPQCAPGDANCFVQVPGISLGSPVGGGIASAVLYSDTSRNVASDVNFTRNVGTLTNIADSFGAGEASAIQLNPNVLGLGIKGAELSQSVTRGDVGGVFTGDATSMGDSDVAVGLISKDNVGNQVLALFDKNAGAKITASDGFNNSGALTLTSLMGALSYTDSQHNTNAIQAGSFGVQIVNAGSVVGTFPTADGTAGQVLTTDGLGGWSFMNPTGGSGSPAASNTDVQFNNNGVFGGSSNFTWDNSNGTFKVGTPLTGNSFEIDNTGGTGITADVYGLASFQIRNAQASNLGFSVSLGANPRVLAGDISGVGNNTKFDVNDAASNILATTDGSFTVQDSSALSWLKVDTASQLVQVGNTGSGAYFETTVGGGGSLLGFTPNVVTTQQSNIWQVADGGNNVWSSVNTSAKRVILGDVTGTSNNTSILINDNTKSITETVNQGIWQVADLANNPFVYADNAGASRIYAIGDINSTHNGTGLKINDNSGTVVIGDIYNNNTNFQVNKNTNTLQFGKSGITALSFNLSTRKFAIGDTTNLNSHTSFLVDDSTQSYSFSQPNISIDAIPYVFPAGQATTAGSALINDGLGNLSWTVPTAAAGGNNQAVQFNNNGLVSGTNNLTWNGSSLNVHASDGLYITAPSFSADGFHFITSDVHPNVPEVDFDVGGGRKALFGYDGNVGRTTIYSDTYQGGVYIYDSQGIAIGTNPLAYSGNALYIEQPVHGPTSQVYTASGVKFGVGATPTDDLTVSDTSALADVASFTNSVGTCTISPTSSSLSCSSDQRLKKNITDISSATALSQVLQLQAVTFNWNPESDTTTPHIGFIAQQVQQVFPQFVTTDANGYLGVSYGSFAPVLAESIKALNLKITDIQNFASATDTTFLTSIENWLANATNGIKQIYANTFTGQEVDTNTLCVTDSTGAKTCITKSQLDQLLSGQGSQSSGGLSVTTTTGIASVSDTTTNTSPGTTSGTDTSAGSGISTTSSSDATTTAPDVGSSSASTTDTSGASGSSTTATSDASSGSVVSDPTTPDTSSGTTSGSSDSTQSSPDTSAPATTGSTDSGSASAPVAPTGN